MHSTLCTTREIPQEEYRRHYTMGWNSSGGNPRATACMSEAEDRWFARYKHLPLSAEHHAWTDGWLDFASGRTKFHLETCGDNHHNDVGGCGSA